MGGVLYFTGKTKIRDLDRVLLEIGRIHSVVEENYKEEREGGTWR